MQAPHALAITTPPIASKSANSPSRSAVWRTCSDPGVTTNCDRTVNPLSAACRATARLAQSGQLQDKFHVTVEQVLNKDGTPSVRNLNQNYPSLVRGEDGQLHLEMGSIKVTTPNLKLVVAPAKSLEARMEKERKAQEFQEKHSLSDIKQKDSKKADPKKEAPQKPAPKKQAPAKGGGGRTK